MKFRRLNVLFKTPLSYPTRGVASFHLDPFLLLTVAAIIIFGLFILYSATDQDWHFLESQWIRISLAFVVMIVLAQFPPTKYRIWAPWIFLFAFILLFSVLIIGHIGKGAQRWLNLGILRFQPSELMITALPLILSWYFAQRPLPPNFKDVAFCSLLIVMPAVLTAKQPDLGTAILLVLTGFGILVLAGLGWRIILALFLFVFACLPILWHFMHPYQRERVITFLNPESDPLGAGYHIIQSKIAIGSGGIVGKGWLHGTQSHLAFLPEHATDFIFAVTGEEFGLIGCVVLLILYACIIGRGFYIASLATGTFARLLAGSIAITFFLSVFINIGMVIGILPVVGLPLPLISYGGTSVVIAFANLGILMSIQTHPKLVNS